MVAAHRPAPGRGLRLASERGRESTQAATSSSRHATERPAITMGRGKPRSAVARASQLENDPRFCPRPRSSCSCSRRSSRGIVCIKPPVPMIRTSDAPRGLVAHVVHHAVDATHLVHDPARGPLLEARTALASRTQSCRRATRPARVVGAVLRGAGQAQRVPRAAARHDPDMTQHHALLRTSYLLADCCR